MKKTKTWIVTFILLQLQFLCFGSPCGNPVTDAVNDIGKLVGNLPKDYNMTLKYVPVHENLPKHCWLYVMLNEVSLRLLDLSTKFNKTSENYLYIDKLLLIMQGIRECVQLSEQMEDMGEYYLPEESFFPDKFFSFVTKTIEVFKEINNTDYDSSCVMPTMSDYNNGYSSHSTNQNLPYVPSTLKNTSRIISSNTNEPSSNISLHWTSIASTGLGCLFIGFLFGALCWSKVKHRAIPIDPVGTSNFCESRDSNESNNMLQPDALI
uniref:Kit ligand n=1 Tax=Leptobrachium leishanense TaxID=445787 RepID=A0A8C5QRW8_9ANUR